MDAFHWSRDSPTTGAEVTCQAHVPGVTIRAHSHSKLIKDYALDPMRKMKRRRSVDVRTKFRFVQLWNEGLAEDLNS